MSYTVGEMADRMAINDTLIRYVHGLDDEDIDALDTVFLPECVFDLTAAGAMKATWREVRPFYEVLHRTTVDDLHMFGMSRITFSDEERQEADVRSKVINPIVMKGDDGKDYCCQVHGTYDDVFTRRPEGWRIRSRTWNMGWISGEYPFEEDMGMVRMRIAQALMGDSAKPMA